VTDWAERAAAFERAYALRSGLSIEQLREAGRIVAPCRCGQPGCPRWQSLSRKLWREDAEYRNRYGGDFVWPELEHSSEGEATDQRPDAQVDVTEGHEDNIDHQHDESDDRADGGPGRRALDGHSDLS
jgi:hypothetical protein